MCIIHINKLLFAYMSSTSLVENLDSLKEFEIAKNLVWFLLGDADKAIEKAATSVAHYLEIDSTGNFHHALAERLIHSQNPTIDGENMSERVNLLQESIQDSLRSLIWNAVKSATLHRWKK